MAGETEVTKEEADWLAHECAEFNTETQDALRTLRAKVEALIANWQSRRPVETFNDIWVNWANEAGRMQAALVEISNRLTKAGGLSEEEANANIREIQNVGGVPHYRLTD